MDENRIGLVSAKTSELRSKIDSCIRKAESKAGKDFKQTEGLADLDYQEDEDVESLLNIRDAFESLERLLSSLQTLQQQQLYEKETTLNEIWYSQKKLLRELKEYKGKDMGVIHEAISFASETEKHNDLLQPHSPVINDDFRTLSNGVISFGLKDLPKPQRRGPFEMLKALIGAGTKTALTVVSVIVILSVAGFEPRLRKRHSKFDFLSLFRFRQMNEETGFVRCPPGKVLMIENGETSCVVRERVEVPFESLVGSPDVNYGCG